MNKKKNNLINDEFADTFYRYQNGKLSSEEKEDFERQLAQDKLKRLAAEGLAAISHDDFLKSKQKFINSNRLQNKKTVNKVRFIYTVSAIAAIFILALIVNAVFFTKDIAQSVNPVTVDVLTDTTNTTHPISFGSANKKTGSTADTSMVYPLGGYQNFDNFVKNRISDIPGNHILPHSILVKISILPTGHVDTVIVKKGVNNAVDLKIKDIIKNGPLWKTSRQLTPAANNTVERTIEINTN